ncbi:MAG: ADP-ribosylglycohydrolase family protein, partial [Desulfobacterales bacterium]|nr:ADP-ribosylglycohydrolase family protein [Desulfobacterales bacterium]
MIGAIAGDIIGSVFEHHPIKTTAFPLFSPASCFTDDTVLSVAIADAILHQTDYGPALKTYGRRYPAAGYGLAFFRWMQSDDAKPYNSWGNGSAMRVSAVGFAFNAVEDVLLEAQKTAVVTHNHPEGIKGAQATALAIYLARQGAAKSDIRHQISERFRYDLDRRLDEIRPRYRFDVSCQGSVPEAILAFLESMDFEDALRLAVSLGGDSDTMACIAGGIAQAYYGSIPRYILDTVRRRLPEA